MHRISFYNDVLGLILEYPFEFQFSGLTAGVLYFISVYISSTSSRSGEGTVRVKFRDIDYMSTICQLRCAIAVVINDKCKFVVGGVLG